MFSFLYKLFGKQLDDSIVVDVSDEWLIEERHRLVKLEARVGSLEKEVDGLKKTKKPAKPRTTKKHK